MYLTIKKIMKNDFFNKASWTLLSSVFLSASNIIGLKLLSNLVEKDIYGSVVYIYSNSIIIGSVVGLGLGMVVNEMQSSDLKHKDNIYNVLVTFVILLFFIVFFVFFLYGSELSNYLNINFSSILLGVVITLLYSLDNINRSCLIGNHKIKEISRLLIYTTTLGWVISLLLSYYNVENGFLIGITLSFIINVIYTFKLIKKYLKIKFEIYNKNYVDVFKSKILPSFTSHFLGSVPQIIVSTYILKYYGVNYVAVYIIAMYLFRMMLFIPGSIQKILLPYLGIRNQDGKVIFTYKMMLLNGVICFPVIISFLIFQSEIASAYNFDENVVGNIFIYTILSGLLSSISSPVGQLMISLGEYRINLVLNMIWALSYMILATSFLFMNKGINYIMISLFCSYFIHLILSFIFILKVKNEINNRLVF
ncbi:MATE family efflux transporter [Photobacterium leiognathi]|uniref:hypothetical protein n=1 Tax=Photobacterium leiognathi TaxID=553611 RepID=UPI002981BED4|nr:hypothetical protein [Photobacterium leiognathi]